MRAEFPPGYANPRGRPLQSISVARLSLTTKCQAKQHPTGVLNAGEMELEPDLLDMCSLYYLHERVTTSPNKRLGKYGQEYKF